MMSKNKSSKRAFLKYFVTAPALAAMLMAFSFAGIQHAAEEIPAQTTAFEATVDSLPPSKASRSASTEAKVLQLTDVDQMPLMAGCEKLREQERDACSSEKLMQFLASSLKYPAAAREKKLEGIVAVSFVIDQNGKVVTPKILKSLGEGCDEEVLRVIRAMPSWIPGKKDDKTVSVAYTLPVKFKLSGEEKASATVTDKAPVFAGCQDAKDPQACSNEKMIQFISERMKYPEAAKKAGVEGMAVVSFVVGEDGQVRDAKLVKGFNKACDEVALQIVQAMPRWEPGVKDGKALSTELALPFKFALPKEKE
ncbi:MAG: energy transducer TonB [Lewinellaceae bacterium]|nr:energy transducer TonB [Lewinellaceae bacterium]